MKNLPFTLWMLLYPVAAVACNYVQVAKLRRVYTDRQQGLSALFDLLTWLGVGYLLYGS